MDFSEALKALKDGKRVCRAGWNGKGMFLYYVPTNRYPAQTETAKRYWADKQPTPQPNTETPIMVPYGAYIAMKTAQENVVPWLCSQTDMLAYDWQIAE